MTESKGECPIKKNFNFLHRLAAYGVTAAMLLTSLPLMSEPVEAATISNKYNYVLKVTTANEKNAKTDNDIYCIIKDARGNERSIKLDNKGDDFRKGGTDTYNLSLDLQPWEIHAVGFQHKSGVDAVKIASFTFTLPDETTYSKTINTWFNKYKKTYSVMSTTDRQIKTVGNFNSLFDKTYYYDAESTNAADLNLEWNGRVSDQYFSEYNFFDYAGAVGVTFSASGKSYNGKSSINQRVLEDNDLAEIITKDGYDRGIKLYTSKLLKFMQDNQIYKFTLTATLDYRYEYDQYDSYSKTLTIYRKAFGLGDAVAVTKAYTPVTDQNFYNSAYNTFEIKIPVNSYDNYDAETVASSLASNIKNKSVEARVYYDETTTDRYVTPTDAYSLGTDVYLKCNTPSGYNNPKGRGITVTLDGAKATYNAQTYWLDTPSSDYSSYISTHKVDTAGVDITVLGSDGTPIGSTFDTYKNVHYFKLQCSENSVFVENSDGIRSEGYISYQLFTKDGKDVEPLKNYKALSTTEVLYGTNSVYNVEPVRKVEGEYQLRITTNDIANNKTTVTYPIKLDTVAPRVSYKLNQLTTGDGSKRNEYTFTIEEATSTGKLYYCIVPDGQSMPAPGQNIPENTGAVESAYGIWSFINQNGASKTVVVSVESGLLFDGTLYWYTVDAAGNDSRTEKNSGTNSDGYYYADISINNIEAECELIVDDLTPGRPYYDISFDTNANNRVEYLWRGQSISTKPTVYTAYSDPGYSWQMLPTGGSIQLNGNYTLEYTVTTPDGNSKTYTKDFFFDNTDPMIRLSYADSVVSAEKAITVDVNDLTSIAKLSYQLYKADGTAVGSSVDLQCGLPVVRAELILEPEESGVYYITVTATDVNSQSSQVKSEIFGIRNSAPTIDPRDSIYHRDSSGNESVIYSSYNEIPLTNNREFNVSWDITEDIENLGYLNDRYSLFYCFSADGINYGEWKSYDGVSVYEDRLYAYLENEWNPIVLREGENNIWIKAAFAPAGTDPDTIRHEYFTVNGEQKLILDVTAPEFTFSVDSTAPTADAVYATIVCRDNYTFPDDIRFYDFYYFGIEEITDSDEALQIPVLNIDATDPNTRVIRLKITENIEEPIELEDAAGNAAKVPLFIDCIDRESPAVYLESANALEAGERQDYVLNFWVDKADDTTTEFALIKPIRDLTEDDFYEINPSSTPDPNHPGQEYEVNLNSENIVWGKLPGEAPSDMHGTILDYNGMKVSPTVTDIEYPNGESRTNYQITVYGDEYEGTDNEREEPFILAIRTRDMLGNQTLQSIGNYMLLKNATAAVRSASSVSEYAHELAGIRLNMSVPVYVLPYDKIPASLLSVADGRLDNNSDAAVADFAESIIACASYYTTEPIIAVKEEWIASGTIPIYFADEAGRVYKKTLTVLPPTAERVDDECTVYLAFVDDMPVEVTLYKGDYIDPYWGPESFDDLGTEITADELLAYDISETYSYYVVLNTTKDGVVFDEVVSGNSGVTVDWYGDPLYENDFELVENLSTDTTKVFLLNNTLNLDKSISYTVKITETVPGTGEGAEDTVKESFIGSVYELTLLDATPPEVVVTYSDNNFTNQSVTVAVTPFDPEFMTNSDEDDSDIPFDDSEIIDGTQSDEASGDNGIDEIAITEFMPKSDYGYYLPDIRYSDFTSCDSVSELILTFEENGAVGVRVTNEIGMVTYKIIEVTNICKDDISEDDYMISYYVPGGEEEYDPDNYYNEVEVEFYDYSYGKGITVTNNGGSTVKLLTPNEPSFTFMLRDKYGNTAEVTVSHDNFDTTAPEVAVTPSVTGKTNEPYKVWIDAFDTESGIKSVEVLRYTNEGAETIDVTDDNSYYVTVPTSGVYAVTVADSCGNIAETSFTVTNIDTTEPRIADRKYTVAQNIRTRHDVGVKLYFSEPDVTITKVELPDGMLPGNVFVNYNEAIIRFYENGSVKVTFVDGHGNQTTDDVAVTNIWRKAPVLVPEVEVAADSLSASVTFEADPVNMRDISEYYVIHSGVTPVDEFGEVLRADKVKFTFIENGTYTFFVHDILGNMTELTVDITGIDRTAPKITGVKWTYTYIDADGSEKTVNQSVTTGDEAGYNVVADESNPATNKDITASVTTDKDTKLVGSDAVDYSKEHSVVYDSDGWYNFNVVRPNGLMDSYGLGLYLIDKEAPVIEVGDDLMFFENPNANAPYDPSLLAVTAYDERYGERIDLTDKVEISFTYNGAVYDDLELIKTLPYDKSKPITVIYTVSDSVGNVATARRSVTLVGLFDTTIRVNGDYTDANGMIEVDGGTVVLTLDNFAGIAYARYESGIHTMGQMKNVGTVITSKEDGSFELTGLAEGWYTFYVQTDLRDYFCVKVYVFAD